MLSPTTKVLIEIFKAVKSQNTAVLVGGQALLVWAIHYEGQGHRGLQVATKDIDIVGTKETVAKLEKVLKTTPNVPGWGDATPELGVFHVPIGKNQRLTIDVLGTVAGLSKADVEKFAVEFEMGGTTIKVLSPVGMLKTRITNVLTLRRTDQHSMSQLNATVRIARCFIDSLLDHGGYRFAAKGISYILHMAEDRQGIQIYSKYGINILDAIPISHIKYPSSFTDRHLKACLDRIERKRLAKIRP